jgi:transketolase
MRPGDAEECAAAFAHAFSRKDGPTLLALTRQDIPHQGSVPAKVRREGTLKGGYVLIKEKGALKTIIIATGSEVQHAVDAAKKLGDGVRVVSMPCTEIFDRQSESYCEEVLPSSCENRIAIEAGVTALWWKYVGLKGKVIGIDRFGLSAPGNVVMKELGITAEAVVEAAK